MSSHASVPSEAEPTSLADLIADGVTVQRLLRTQAPAAAVPGQRTLTIPEPALAVVAGLDRYGD